MSSGRTFLILHGWGGNKPEHWQEHLKAALTAAGESVHAPAMPNPRTPSLVAWILRLDEELRSLAQTGPVTVLAHSLGAITWLHYVTAVQSQIAESVLLVAPPYVMPGIPPTDAPPGVEAFFPPPMDGDAVRRAAAETVIVASDNDDYATFEQSKAYSDRLGVPIHLVAGAGHISPYWGYGEWPWVLDWCVGKAKLPPIAK